MELNPSPVTAIGFARRDTRSHMSHAKEMGLNQRDYEQEAIKIFNSNKGVLYNEERTGRLYRYDPKTNKVAVCETDGNIRTYFIADKNWLRKKEKRRK